MNKNKSLLKLYGRQGRKKPTLPELGNVGLTGQTILHTTTTEGAVISNMLPNQERSDLHTLNTTSVIATSYIYLTLQTSNELYMYNTASKKGAFP